MSSKKITFRISRFKQEHIDPARYQNFELEVLPNMTVFAPSDANQTKRIVQLMAENIGPMYARVGRANAPLIYKKEDLSDIKIGKGMTITEGDDISIIACGTMVDHVLDASKELLKEGISARIIDMHTIKPIDSELVKKCLKETNAIITAEEHSIF